MCMLFILQVAQRGYERDLRGIQRLLCTLLCTRSNPYINPVPPSAAPLEVKPRLVASAPDCTFLFCRADWTLLGNRGAVRPYHLKTPVTKFREYLPAFRPEEKRDHHLVVAAISRDGVMEIEHCSDRG